MKTEGPLEHRIRPLCDGCKAVPPTAIFNGQKQLCDACAPGGEPGYYAVQWIKTGVTEGVYFE